MTILKEMCMNRIGALRNKAGKGLFTLAIILLTSTVAFAGSSDFKKSYPGKCIGGNQCGGKRNQLIIPLKESVLVERIEFYADDNVGSSANARVSVFADDELIAEDIDIRKEGKRHVIEVDRHVRQIRIKPANDDETNIHEVKVYGTIERSYPDRNPPKIKPYKRSDTPDRTLQETIPGKCIGGNRCGGWRNHMVIPLSPPVFVDRIEIYADSSIGRSRDSAISVFADDQAVAQNIRIRPSKGRYTVEIGEKVRKIRIQPAGNDETNIHEVVVYYSTGGSSHEERGPFIEKRPFIEEEPYIEQRPYPGRGSSRGGSSGSSF